MANNFLQDANGDYSSMRLVYTAWGLVPLIIWAIICIWHSQLVDIPLGVGSTIGGIVIGKVWQSYSEKKPDAVNTSGS